ncbi:hypothetical protein [Cupriavidus basilensis]|nr:hypothetical protein [Cupriavidus basilensis]
MHSKSAIAALVAAALAAALLASAAQAASPQDRTVYSDRCGCNFRAEKADPYTDGGRTGKFDSFGEGARQVDPFTDGARA